MVHRAPAAALALILSACAPARRAVPAPDPQPPGWVDPSPHRARFVTVAAGVQLEILDWGGAGPPLFFLAGLGCSAHVFDDFAPELRDRFHVYGVTRRGFGASSRPGAGYDVATLGADLVGVLRELGLGRASFVGHAFAGEELTWLAVHAPDRVDKLVYLDAAYDRVTLREARKGEPRAPSEPRAEPTGADEASVAAYGAFVERTYGVRMPEGELRARGVFDADGRYLRVRTPGEIERAIAEGAVHPEYGRVTAPALSIYTLDESAEASVSPAFWGALSDLDHARLKARHAYYQPILAKERDRFAREVIHGKVLEIRGANHYLFLSDRVLVLRKVRSFLGP
jgi:pimeloyl-ACP methyl ester carboxylesterase